MPLTGILAQKFTFKWTECRTTIKGYRCKQCAKLIADTNGEPLKGVKFDIWTGDMICPRCWHKVGVATSDGGYTKWMR